MALRPREKHPWAEGFLQAYFAFSKIYICFQRTEERFSNFRFFEEMAKENATILWTLTS